MAPQFLFDQAVFGQSTPPYFAAHERAAYSNFPTAPFAVLTWDIVARNLRRQGIGRLLIETCLADLREIPRLERVVLETSQYSYPFFEKFGFAITAIQENGFGDGLDIYSMSLTLPV